MNILRKTRKKNIKIRKRRYVLLIFSLIMTAFAWITYSKILSPGMKVHINSWDISIYVDANKNGVAEESEKQNTSSPIDISILQLYPGMNEEVVNVIIKNNGETPSTIDYLVNDISLLGNPYTIEEDAAAYREANPDSFCIQENTKTTSGGVVSYELINEPGVFPFKFVIEHTEEIDGGAEGYLNVKAIWLSSLEDEDDLTEEEKAAKDEVDSEWGYNSSEFVEKHPTIAPLQFKVIINATGLPRSSRYVLTQDITPANYGDYVNYPIDLNENGDTTDDWKIFYEDNRNIFIISADYVKNTWISEDVMTRSTGEYATYGATFTSEQLTTDSIEKSIKNKYMLNNEPKTIKLKYKKVASLLKTSNWTQFVDSDFADSAVGAPTIEMFAKSWNQKYNGDANFDEIKVNFVIEKIGYMINDKTKNYKVLGAKNANMYFPHNTYDNLDGTDAGDCFGYWIASQSTEQSDTCLYIRYDGVITSFSDIYKRTAIRPIVCLKAGLKGESSRNAAGEIVWNLDNSDLVEE